MNIAFLSHCLPPSWSGQAVIIERLLRGIDEASFVLISRENHVKCLSEKEFIRRLPVRYYHMSSKFGYPGQKTLVAKLISVVPEIIRRAWKISRILKAECCSALVAGTGDVIDLPAACLAGRMTGVSFYPYLFDDYVHQWADPGIRSITTRLEPFIMKHAKGVIVPNEFMQHEIAQRYEIKASIVRNPCESNHVDEKERHDLSLGKNGCSIMYTGAVYEVNFGAFRNLLAALRCSGDGNAALHLYTAQPMDFLENAGISGPLVKYHQHVPPEEVVRMQNSADILFIPFAFDSRIPEVIKTSAPGKLGDYLASGTPILAHVPPYTFVSWYLKKHNCGIVVDEDDPKPLALAIQRLCQDVSLRRTLSKNARRRAIEDFIPLKARQSFLSALDIH